jgi:hypothetical protein
MIDVSKFIKSKNRIEKEKINIHMFIFRIVRNRGNHSSPSGTTVTNTTTTTNHEDDHRTDVYSIQSLLNHSQYEYSALKQRSSSTRINGNLSLCRNDMI